jgi:hypothetical protein
VAAAAAGSGACAGRAGPEPSPPRDATGGAPAVAPAGATWVAQLGRLAPAGRAHNRPPAPGLAGSTLRQVIHLSLGGRALRLRFANTFGDGPVTIAAARVARAAGGSAIDPPSDRALRFGGRPSVTIAAGAEVTTDVLPYDVPPLADLTVSVHVAAMPAAVTGHPGSRTTSYLQPGAHAAAPALPAAARVERWYVLSGAEVLAPAGSAAVVTLGNSITDGAARARTATGAGPDHLARRLQADARQPGNVAVVNAGIGGNAVLAGGLGPTALARLERDVLAQPGVRWLVVLHGVNDIGPAPPSTRPPSPGG